MDAFQAFTSATLLIVIAANVWLTWVGSKTEARLDEVARNLGNLASRVNRIADILSERLGDIMAELGRISGAISRL